MVLVHARVNERTAEEERKEEEEQNSDHAMPVDTTCDMQHLCRFEMSSIGNDEQQVQVVHHWPEPESIGCAIRSSRPRWRSASSIIRHFEGAQSGMHVLLTA